MARELSLFVGTFTTLLAIINPFEVLPVYLKLLEGEDEGTHKRVARKSACTRSCCVCSSWSLEHSSCAFLACLLAWCASSAASF